MPPFEFYTRILFKDGTHKDIGHWDKRSALLCKTDLLRWAPPLFDGKCTNIIVIDKNDYFIG